MFLAQLNLLVAAKKTLRNHVEALQIAQKVVEGTWYDEGRSSRPGKNIQKAIVSRLRQTDRQVRVSCPNFPTPINLKDLNGFPNYLRASCKSIEKRVQCELCKKTMRMDLYMYYA